MRVTTTLPQDRLSRVPDAIRAIEAAGYDGVTTLENRHNPFLPLAVAAVNSSRVELATGVAIAFPRSPMMVANIGWDLQAASDGRFVLGIGSQVKGHNERRFSTPWKPPAPRMREYVESLRAIWRNWKTGEPLDYRGEHYSFTLMTPNFTPEPIEHAPPPITIAAVGPVMLKVAGECCDGARLHPFCSRKYLENQILPRLEKGLAASGRQRRHFEISGGGFIATGPDDETVARMTDWVRMRIGFYGSTRAYWPVLQEHGLEELGQKLNHMSKTNQWDRMTQEVPDDVVRLFSAIGRHDEIAGEIEARFGGVSDTVSASASSEIAGDLPADVIRDIQRIATPFEGFDKSGYE
jgi:probable F420-dependent oxidoreductase